MVSPSLLARTPQIQDVVSLRVGSEKEPAAINYKEKEMSPSWAAWVNKAQMAEVSEQNRTEIPTQ